jgi:hypothetical protein
MTLIGNPRAGLITCRGCGCDDDHACVATVTDSRGRATGTQPCGWVLLDIATPTGVCSACAIYFEWQPDALALVGRDDDGAPIVLQQTLRRLA